MEGQGSALTKNQPTTNLVEVEDQVQLADIAKVLVEHLNKLVDDLQGDELVLIWWGEIVLKEGMGYGKPTTTDQKPACRLLSPEGSHK